MTAKIANVSIRAKQYAGMLLRANQAKTQDKQKTALEAQYKQHDEDISNALNRIVDSRSRTVIAAFDKMYRTAMVFLANPYHI